jgi:hypothetical protein
VHISVLTYILSVSHWTEGSGHDRLNRILTDHLEEAGPDGKGLQPIHGLVKVVFALAVQMSARLAEGSEHLLLANLRRAR